MKKNLFGLLLLFMMMPVVVLASENYYGISMSEEEYNNLLELGFTEEEIYYMEEEEFNNNKNIEGNLEATTEKYFVNIIRYDSTGKIISNNDMEVTEDDYDGNGIMLLSYDGYVETTYKKMVVTIAAASSKYRYKVTLTWKNMPKVRSYDIIGIGFDAGVYNAGGSYVFNQTSCVSTNCTNTNTVNSETIDSLSGLGVSFKLPTSTSLTTLRSYFYFDVSKLSSSGTITEMYAYGDYSHATSTVSSGAANGFYVNQAGIVLSNNIVDSYDSISEATAYWNGTW